MSVLLVAIGAAVGAPARFLTDRAMKRWLPGLFPWGTFTVNVVGSFVLGVVTTTSDPVLGLLVGTGFCGALTTYSTFSYETVALAAGGRRLLALVNLAGSVAAGMLAVVGGWLVGTAL